MSEAQRHVGKYQREQEGNTVSTYTNWQHAVTKTRRRWNEVTGKSYETKRDLNKETEKCIHFDGPTAKAKGKKAVKIEKLKHTDTERRRDIGKKREIKARRGVGKQSTYYIQEKKKRA